MSDLTKIINGELIVGEKILHDKSLIIKGDKILAIEQNAEKFDGKIIDAKGNYVSAGFVDIHTHGGGGYDFMDNDDDAYEKACNIHLLHGATSILPTTLSAGKDEILNSVDRYKKAKANKNIKSNLLGMHLEGPYVSPYQAGAQKKEYIRDFDEKEYMEILDKADGDVKRWSVAPELTGARQFARVMRENDVMLSIAHSNATLEEVRSAIEWGFEHITHFYSAMSTITRRKGYRVLGIVEAGYLFDELKIEIISDACHLPKELLQFIIKMKDNKKIALISDSMRAAGTNVKTSFLGNKATGTEVFIEDGVAKMPDREAFAGSVALSDRLVRTMKELVGMAKAVKMITQNPIMQLGGKIRKGEIKKGYDADINIFDEDVNVLLTMVNGKTVNNNLF